MSSAAAFEIRRVHGRLVLSRPRIMRTVDDVTALGAAMKDTARSISGPLVICGDYRVTTVLSQSTADAFIAMFSVFNPRIQRSAVLLSSQHATFNLQVERLVREARNPARRTFRAVPDMLAWLGEVLTPEESAALDRAL